MLHPLQQAVVTAMLADLKAIGHTVLRAGQRSGKSTMIPFLIAGSDYTSIHLFAPATGHAMNEMLGWKMSLAFPDVKISTSWPEPSHEKPLIVLCDAFWLTDSFQRYQQALHEGHHVLAYGSNGPEFSQGWANVSAHSYSTADLNPKFNQEQLETSPDHDDPRWVRDYLPF